MQNSQVGHRLQFGWLLVMVGLSSCTKWQVQQVPPRQLLADGQPEKIRVARNDKVKVVLQRPEIRGDSLYGIRDESALRLDRAGRQTTRHGAHEAMALVDIQNVAVRKTDPVTTGLLVGAGVALGFFAIGLSQVDR